MPGRIADEPELRDGERVLIRPIRPTDEGQLAALHSRLSPDSIYLRYFGIKPRLSSAERHRFTRIDADWRFALVGVRGTGELAGVARYEGAADSAAAEIALIVDDAMHHLGLGSLLLRRLVDVAVMNGMASLDAVVLMSNQPMLALLRTLPVPTTSVRDAGTVVVTLNLTGLELHGDRSHVAAAHVAVAAAIRADVNLS
jgi:hypothetical protein